MAQQLLVRSSFAVDVVVVVQICCRPVVRGKKKGPYRCHIKLNNHELIFCRYCCCNGDCVVFDHFFISILFCILFRGTSFAPKGLARPELN